MRSTTPVAAAVFAVSLAAVAQVPWRGVTAASQLNSAGEVAISRSSADGGEVRVVGASPLMNGLFSYPLDGGFPQVMTLGVARGVSARSGLRFLTAPADVVVATGYVTGTLHLFGLAPSGILSPINARAIVTTVGPGHLALFAPGDGGLEALWETGTGSLSRVQLFDDTQGRLDYATLPNVDLPGQPLSLAVDDVSRRLLATVPLVGVVGLALDDPTATAELLEPVDGGVLGGLPYGLALYRASATRLVALVTVPSTNEVVAYDVLPHRLGFITRFTLSLGGGQPMVRGAQHVAVSTLPVDGFPGGLLVLQDPASLGGANYKLAALADVAAGTSPRLPLPGDGPADGGAAPDGGAPADGGVDGGPTVAQNGGGGGGDFAPEPAAPAPPCGCSTPYPLLPGAVVVISALLSRRRRA